MQTGASGAKNGQIIWEGEPNCCTGTADWCRKTHWVITSAYIERSRGVCCPVIDNLQLLRIRDTRYEQCCCCPCGTITLYTTDETDKILIIKGVPHGRVVWEQIRNAVQAVQGNAKLELNT